MGRYDLLQAVCIDDIEAKTNAVQRQDLESILKLTPPDRRVLVTLAFLGWTATGWAYALGLSPKTVCCWVNGSNRMPYGGALRLAKLIGVPPDLLFEHWRH